MVDDLEEAQSGGSLPDLINDRPSRGGEVDDGDFGFRVGLVC